MAPEHLYKRRKFNDEPLLPPSISYFMVELSLNLVLQWHTWATSLSGSAFSGDTSFTHYVTSMPNSKSLLLLLLLLRATFFLSSPLKIGL